MMVVITYDVSTEEKEGRRRLRRVAKTCENFGQRVQKSVFECKVDEQRLHILRERLLDRIDEDEDRLRIYFIREPIEDHREEYGCFTTIDFDEPLII
jgi:CRISPR-associated protein Cas2